MVDVMEDVVVVVECVKKVKKERIRMLFVINQTWNDMMYLEDGAYSMSAYEPIVTAKRLRKIQENKCMYLAASYIYNKHDEDEVMDLIKQVAPGITNRECAKWHYKWDSGNHEKDTFFLVEVM
jgi:hypothetical protein